jgi:wobble nucleotide-excising tRNase
VSVITKISRLKHPGVLRDFTWPADLPSFGRFNLIYGWNGHGKTTLSRFFRALEQRVAPASGEITLEINGQQLAGKDFHQATVPVRVFNRDFVNESVFPVGVGEVPPIFVVGKESVEKQKQVDRLKAERADKEAALQNARSTHQQAERNLDRHCVERAQVIKDALRVPGQGAYNNYNKTSYRTRAGQMLAAGDASSHQLSDDERESCLIQHRATAKPKVSPVQYRFPPLASLHKEVSELLSGTVTSAAIASLKDDAILSDWVREGLRLHTTREVESCLFCERSLPRARIVALEAHFNDEYERLVRRLDQESAKLKQHFEELRNLHVPDRMALYEDLLNDYDAACSSLFETRDAATTYITRLQEALEAKKRQPFKSLQLDFDLTVINDEVIDCVNKVISRHNEGCDDFQTRMGRARDRLALDLIAKSIDEYSRLSDAEAAAAAAIAPLEEDIQRLTQEIERLQREIVEHQQPAEELNEDLRNYLGHGEIRVEVKDTGYQLLRNGEPAEALSEGERTALALLYFLKSLRDRRFDLRNGVVVLDDPVSSLDAHALYLAFGFIRERTQGAGQLFVLTHNFAFFRQVRNWFINLRGKDKKSERFYMLDRIHGVTPRRTTLCALDPLLKKYESEYHYLFARVHRATTATDQASLEQNYALPNIARRLLEMFLAFRKPHIGGHLWQKLEDVNFDKARAIRIVRFVDTHSHGDAVAGPEHDPSLLGEARAVLADLLELIKSEDPKHFEAMESLVSRPAGETEAA